MEELNCKVVFTIPVGKGLPIYESVVVTWIVMAILVLLSIILVCYSCPESKSRESGEKAACAGGWIPVFPQFLS